MYIDFPEIILPAQGLESVNIPEMYRIRQIYDNARIEDPGSMISEKLRERFPDGSAFSGKRICITAGSREIPNVVEMLKTVAAILKSWGAEPFLVPAMGSHGGATAQGQTKMLAGYHITEESIGIPILSSMEVVQYDSLEGVPLYCDKNAMDADGIVVFNKIKPHTDFRGEHESGLAKMIAIGMAKHAGATMFHSFGFDRLGSLLPEVTRRFLATGKLAFGIGVVQNAYDDICNIRICEKEDFLQTDKEMLVEAKDKIAKFKFDNIDVLIIDEIGKNISGTGCDPNIVGRNLTQSIRGPLHLQRMFIRSLTPEAHHNGCGLGMADITTRACLADVDWETTWINVMTTGALCGGRIPMYANTDEDAVRYAIRSCHNCNYENPRIVRIKNTLSMTEIEVSKAIYEEISNQADVELVKGPYCMQFDANGKLMDS